MISSHATRRLTGQRDVYGLFLSDCQDNVEISLLYAYGADIVLLPVLPLIHLFHVSGYDLYE